MLQLKDGVVLAGTPYTNAILAAVQEVYTANGWDTVITAGRDGRHGPKSYHYQDRACDIRFWCVPHEKREEIAQVIRGKLPVYYDVVVEEDHYHIEADRVKEALHNLKKR